MAGIPIAGAILGGVAGYKDAKSAKKAADKGIDTTEKTTRDPYGPATTHIQSILDEAARIYGQGQQGPMPYAWQNFMNNPTSPGIGADPTYGGSAPSGGGGGGAAAAEHPLGLTWKGQDKAQVRQARQDKRDARNAPAASAAGSGSSPAAAAASAASAPSGPTFTPQSGPFGYSKGIRDFMMEKYQQPGGVQGYQPAMDYITQLLGGHSQNPFLTQTFDRASAPQKDYFAQWRK